MKKSKYDAWYAIPCLLYMWCFVAAGIGIITLILGPEILSRFPTWLQMTLYFSIGSMGLALPGVVISSEILERLDGRNEECDSEKLRERHLREWRARNE